MVDLADEPTHDAADAPQLLRGGDARGAWAGRLGTNVQDARPGAQHRHTPRDRGVPVQVDPAVGKAIGCDVQHPHQHRPPQLHHRPPLPPAGIYAQRPHPAHHNPTHHHHPRPRPYGLRSADGARTRPPPRTPNPTVSTPTNTPRFEPQPSWTLEIHPPPGKSPNKPIPEPTPHTHQSPGTTQPVTPESKTTSNTPSTPCSWIHRPPVFNAATSA